MYFAFLYNFCSKYFLLYEEFSAIPQMHTGPHVECLSFVSDFSGNLIIYTDSNINLIKFCPIGQCLSMHADGRTDMTKLIVHFINFQFLSYSIPNCYPRLINPILTTGWTVRGSNPGWDEIFRPSRPALGPTQPPVKCLFPGGKVRPGSAADHSPASSAAVMEQ
jgi:hypothetical protein